MGGQRLRVGAVGAGLVGRRHIDVLAEMADVEIVAVADAALDAATSVAREVGCEPFVSGLEMIHGVELDAVWLCVPPFAHGELELAAVERGVPFFVEKPIARDRRTARSIAAAVEQRGLLTAVGYQWRHLDTVGRARSLLASTPPRLALAEWSSKMPRAPWWRTEALSGGQILEQGTHLFDLVRHLVGEPRRAVGTCVRPGETDCTDADVATAAAVTLELDDRAIAVVTTTCLLSRPHRIGIRLFGAGIVIDLSETHMVVDHDGEIEHTEVAVNPFADEDRQFLDAVRAGAFPDDGSVSVPYGEALRTHEVVLGAIEAISTGQSVDLMGPVDG